MNLKSQYYLLIILSICVLQLVVGITGKDIMEWDEARNGVNAFEMLQNSDYINLHYGGVPDTWNAKPPLLTWCIVLCYKIFGFNEVSLRLPAAISTLLFFVVFFRLVKMMEGTIPAFLSCLILLGCKGIIGFHGGINGDYDAVLLLFLVSSAYYFIRFAEFGDHKAIYALALFTGLSFYTKGTAGLIFLPGFLLYIIFKGEIWQVFKSRRTWGAIALLMAIILSWIIVAIISAKPSDHNVYGSKNTIETMFVHDTYRRLTSNDFENENIRDRLFFIKAMDVRMNLWNYLFYLSAAAGLYTLYKNRGRIIFFVKQTSNKLTVFSICIAAPVVLVLNFSVNMHDWYFVPVWAFIAFITVKGTLFFAPRFKGTYYVFAALCLFTIVRQFLFLNSLPKDLNNNLSTASITFKNEGYIVLVDNPKQNLLLYLNWMQNGFQRITNSGQLHDHKGKTIIITKDQLASYAPHMKSINYFDEYCVGEIY